MTTDQGSLLDLIANDPRRDDEYARFVNACFMASRYGQDAVSVNGVRRWFTNEHGLTIHPQTYSSFWRRARLDGHLERTGEWETNTDSRGRNSGKPQPVYRWVGGA